MDKVTKADLIEAIYADSKFEKQDIKKIVELLFDEIKDSLGKGKYIEIRGFGSFEVRLHKGREKARNPKTGEEVSVPPRYAAAFRAGRELKNILQTMEVPENL